MSRERSVVKCPECGTPFNEVAQVVPRDWFNWRRRLCLNCKLLFTTHERIPAKKKAKKNAKKKAQPQVAR